MIWLTIAAVVFLLDYKVKKWAEAHLAGEKRKYIGQTGFSLKLIHNGGFACNRLEKKPGLVKAVHFVVVMVLGIYSITEFFFVQGKELASLGMAFILGGGTSNLYDRIKNGSVTDYLGLPKIPKLLFNLSDLFIFLGTILLILGEFAKDK